MSNNDSRLIIYSNKVKKTMINLIISSMSLIDRLKAWLKRTSALKKRCKSRGKMLENVRNRRVTGEKSAEWPRRKEIRSIRRLLSWRMNWDQSFLKGINRGTTKHPHMSESWQGQLPRIMVMIKPSTRSHRPVMLEWLQVKEQIRFSHQEDCQFTIPSAIMTTMVWSKSLLHSNISRKVSR